MAVPTPEVAERIRAKKHRYGRYLDTRQWDELAQVALPNAQITIFDPSGAISRVGSTDMAFGSIKDFAHFCSRIFAGMQTLHMFGQGELEQTARDEVKAIWSMEDQIISTQLWGGIELRGGGFYHEKWRLVEGDWFLAELRLERTYLKYSLLARAIFFLAKLFRFKAE